MVSSKIRLFIMVAILFAMYSCEKNKKNGSHDFPDQEVTSNLNVFLDGVIHESTEIKLFFSDSTGNDSLMQNVKGRPRKLQRVSFQIPNGRVPEDLRFELESVNRIDFDKLVFNRNDDRIILRDSAFLVYFNLRNFKVQFNNEKIELLNESKDDAAFIAKQNLISRLNNRY